MDFPEQYNVQFVFHVNLLGDMSEFIFSSNQSAMKLPFETEYTARLDFQKWWKVTWYITPKQDVDR